MLPQVDRADGWAPKVASPVLSMPSPAEVAGVTAALAQQFPGAIPAAAAQGLGRIVRSATESAEDIHREVVRRWLSCVN